MYHRRDDVASFFYLTYLTNWLFAWPPQTVVVFIYLVLKQKYAEPIVTVSLNKIIIVNVASERVFL